MEIINCRGHESFAMFFCYPSQNENIKHVSNAILQNIHKYQKNTKSDQPPINKLSQKIKIQKNKQSLRIYTMRHQRHKHHKKINTNHIYNNKKKGIFLN